MLSRDLQRILKIRDYCLGIQDTIARFGNSPDSFLLDSDYQQSLAFSILQIGELTGGLSEEYRSSTKEQIQWPHIKEGFLLGIIVPLAKRSLIISSMS